MANAPDRAVTVRAWVATHRNLFKSREGVDADDIRREILIPLGQHLNEIEGRNVWGRLIKRDRTPPHIPHDILVWKDTREHFDVFTGTARVEDTEASWAFNAPPDNPNWQWLDVGEGEPEPPDEPEHPDEIAELKARVGALEATALSQTRLLREMNAAHASLRERVEALEQKPDPVVVLPELVVEGFTESVGPRWLAHRHPVRLDVKPK